MRILIVDDHPVTRDGLRSALSITDEVDIVGEAASGEEAIEAVEKLKPEVVFMDVRMPGMGGIEATRIIKQENPETRVILFTVDESRQAISEAIQAGVSGYLLKDVTPAELVNAARLALRVMTRRSNEPPSQPATMPSRMPRLAANTNETQIKPSVHGRRSPMNCLNCSITSSGS